MALDISVHFSVALAVGVDVFVAVDVVKVVGPWLWL